MHPWIEALLWYVVVCPSLAIAVRERLSVGIQRSTVLTPTNLGVLLSPLANAVTVGAMHWQAIKPRVKEGRVMVRTDILDLDEGELIMRIRAPAPSEPKLTYLIGGAAARRLCVNGNHPPLPGTHKHRFRISGADEDAYAPDDIPDVPLAPRVAPGVYRAILEAFASECFITVGDDCWTEP